MVTYSARVSGRSWGNAGSPAARLSPWKMSLLPDKKVSEEAIYIRVLIAVINQPPSGFAVKLCKANRSIPFLEASTLVEGLVSGM